MRAFVSARSGQASSGSQPPARSRGINEPRAKRECWWRWWRESVQELAQAQAHAIASRNVRRSAPSRLNAFGVLSSQFQKLREREGERHHHHHQAERTFSSGRCWRRSQTSSEPSSSKQAASPSNHGSCSCNPAATAKFHHQLHYTTGKKANEHSPRSVICQVPADTPPADTSHQPPSQSPLPPQLIMQSARECHSGL